MWDEWRIRLLKGRLIMLFLCLSALLGLLASTPLAQAEPYYPPVRRYQDRADQQVRYWVKSYLRRSAEPGEVRYLAGLLRSGRSPASILSRLLANREYLDYAGDTRAGFIKQLLLDVGHHEPSGREIRHFLYQTRGQRRRDVAYSFLLRYPQNWIPGLPASPPDEDEENWD